MEDIEENGLARASLLKRFVSLFRCEWFAVFYSFIAVVVFWSVCGFLAEKSGLITHYAWWMFYGFIVGKLSWWLDGAVKNAVTRKES